MAGGVRGGVSNKIQQLLNTLKVGVLMQSVYVRMYACTYTACIELGHMYTHAVGS